MSTWVSWVQSKSSKVLLNKLTDSFLNLLMLESRFKDFGNCFKNAIRLIVKLWMSDILTKPTSFYFQKSTSLGLSTLVLSVKVLVYLASSRSTTKYKIVLVSCRLRCHSVLFGSSLVFDAFQEMWRINFSFNRNSDAFEGASTKFRNG